VDFSQGTMSAAETQFMSMLLRTERAERTESHGATEKRRRTESPIAKAAENGETVQRRDRQGGESQRRRWSRFAQRRSPFVLRFSVAPCDLCHLLHGAVSCLWRIPIKTCGA
jgi:hypothetical protein